MSFILDALKKSESDRQRQGGPALFEVKVAPPRTRLPLWAIALALLLAVNAVIVAWMMLRHPSPPAQAAAAAGPGAAVTAVPALVTGAVAQPAPTVVTGAAVAAAATQPPLTAPPPAATLPAAGVAASGGTEEPNPEDLAPAAEPGPSLGGGHVRRDTADGVPLYQELAVAPGAKMPQLRLDLHVYAARPQERFVMINMHKLREGEALPEGVRVESITPEGAVMSYNGSRFLLPRD